MKRDRAEGEGDRAVEWDSLALAPTINVKCGWSVRYKDESETMIDPLQAKLGLDAEDNS
jgi:hypothetical protein